MKTLACILFCILCIQDVFALDVIPIEQGKPSPISGFVISYDTEKHFRLIDTELDYNQKLNLSLDSINKNYQSQIDIMQTRIDNQQKHIDNLSDKAVSGFWSDFAKFMFGAGTATLITWGVARAVK